MEKALLIADDEDAVRMGISKYITLHTDRFDNIYTAKNGQEAIDSIFLHKPGIMLLDVRMPIKDGVEVMQEAAARGILPATIVLSGYDEFSYAQQAVNCGAKKYLLKPTRSSDILTYIHKLADEIFGLEGDKEKLEEGVPTNIIRAEQYIKEHYHENISAQNVAEYVGLSASYMSTLFTQYRGYGFSDLLNQIRIEHACIYLEQGFLKNYEIAYKVGYRDEKYFSKTFHRVKHISPAAYKKEVSHSYNDQKLLSV